MDTIKQILEGKSVRESLVEGRLKGKIPKLPSEHKKVADQMLKTHRIDLLAASGPNMFDKFDNALKFMIFKTPGLTRFQNSITDDEWMDIVNYTMVTLDRSKK